MIIHPELTLIVMRSGTSDDPWHIIKIQSTDADGVVHSHDAWHIQGPTIRQLALNDMLAMLRHQALKIVCDHWSVVDQGGRPVSLFDPEGEAYGDPFP